MDGAGKAVMGGCMAGKRLGPHWVYTREPGCTVLERTVLACGPKGAAHGPKEAARGPKGTGASRSPARRGAVSMSHD